MTVGLKVAKYLLEPSGQDFLGDQGFYDIVLVTVRNVPHELTVAVPRVLLALLKLPPL